MNLLTAKLKPVTLRDQKRLLLAPVCGLALAASMSSSGGAIISSAYCSLITTVHSSLPTIFMSSTGGDGFAAWSQAHYSSWQPVSSQPTFNQATSSQTHGGLLGAAVDPAFGGATEVGMVADYSYDHARDYVRLTTILTALVSSLYFACKIKTTSKLKLVWRVLRAIIYVALLTAFVNSVGMYIMNNFGGLGGGF